MAAAATRSTISKSPLSNNERTRDSVEELPSGRCNFTRLDGSGGRCGCLRYWDKSKFERKHGDNAGGWCMCEHHACFHESGNGQSHAALQVATAGSVHDSTSLAFTGPSTNRGVPSRNVTTNVMKPNNQDPSKQWSTIATEPHTNVDAKESEPWDVFIRSNPSASWNPPLPSECLLPPDVSSGAISGDSQAFLAMLNEQQETQSEGHGNTHANDAMALQRLETALTAHQADEEMYNASTTHENTPNPGSPELGTSHDFDFHVRQLQSEVHMVDPCSEKSPSDLDIPTGPQATSTVRAIRPSTLDAPETPKRNIVVPVQRIMPHLESILKHVSVFPSLSTTAENHARRIDLLENASYSNIAIDELQDTTETLRDDIREVEGKIEDLARTVATMNDAGSVTSFRRGNHLRDDQSETSSAMISAAIDHAELSSRLDALESQLLPSYARPWELEVIYLPFGVNLKGLWFTLDNFPSQRSRCNSMAADGWTQTQHAMIGREQKNLDDARSAQQSWEEVAGRADDTPWLVPRACGIGSKVEERLRSRGLIRTIQVKGADARDVQAAMTTAFGDTLDAIGDAATQGSPTTTYTMGYHGLHASWIPLRKIHKDSRLRLLDPSEMVTPSLWTVIFLSSSVAMRATGVQRLYVTHRDAYMQATANCDNWTWQKIRELPRFYADLQSSAEVREADALEKCWQYDPRLDPPTPSTNSSFESHSHHSTLSIRNVANAARQSPSSSSKSSHALSTTPTSLHNPLPRLDPPSPLAERHPSALRPLHGRTTSMPLMPLALKTSPFPLTVKRRIASFDQEAELPPPAAQHPQSSPTKLQATSPVGFPIMTSKRQRVSRSPSRPRDTPRWSVGPPSPYIFEDMTAHKRATTPFAYATPHSNFTPFNEHRIGNDRDDDYGDEDEDEKDSMTDDMDDIGLGMDEYWKDNNANDDEYQSNHYTDNHPATDARHGLGQQGEAVDIDADEVWEGVEDDGFNETFGSTNDAEQKALSDEDDDGNASEASSLPSEYPSTQPVAYYGGDRGTFEIHVDEEEDELGL